MSKNDVKKQLIPKDKNAVFAFLFKILAGAIIGVGAVLPGVSGGVLCVIFGIYPLVMELLSHPFKDLKSKLSLLYPYLIGIVLGFLGIARLLGFLLTRFEAPSICVFVGLVAGMLPSLFVSVGKGRTRIFSYISMTVSCILVLLVLLALRFTSVDIEPGFFWYILCGSAVAISVIVPGMSFSTLLMPLGLYTPLVDGIGRLDFAVLIPVGIGAAVTVVAFARLVFYLFDKHYSVAQSAVIGIVIAATAVIIPYESFGASWGSAILNTLCIALGLGAAILLSRLNKKYEHQKVMATDASIK
jgi:putative membrane protein